MKRLFCALIAVCMLLSLQTPPCHAAGSVVMNFNDVDISTMVKFISELTGKNFVLDERVKGKISVFSPAKLSTDEAFSLFTSVLELKGFTLVQAGKFYKIVPAGSAKQSGMTLLTSGERIPMSDTYMARVFPLEQISSQEALTFLQPLVSKDGHIGSFGPANMLLVMDTAGNLQKIADILHLIDTPQRREGGELVYLKHGSADNIASVLREWLAGKGNHTATPGGTGASQQAISAGSIQVIADTRLNALLLFGTEQDKQDVRKMIAMLDVAPPQASSKVNVCFLENTDATEMAKVLEGVVKGMTTQTTPGQPGTAAQSSPFDSGKITITPDKASNALVIMASPTDYGNLLQVIKKLDRRSKQVYVQVVIAEVSLDKSRALGVQAGAIAAGALGKYLQGGGIYDPFNTFGQILGSSTSSTTTTNPLSTLINNQLSQTTRPVTGLALIQALDANDLINILSTPNILTTDNKEAEINVGENVPFKGSTTQSTFSTVESVERKDIGINLKIKPQISEGNYIRMDIYQEISAVKNDKGQAVDLVTTKRSAKTSVVVKDNETIVIGGLIQDSEDTTVSKVPFLGDIPGLGWLFKTKSKTRKKTNLIILLTPRIIRDAGDLTAITAGQRTEFTKAAKKVGPVDVQREIGAAPTGPAPKAGSK